MTYLNKFCEKNECDFDGWLLYEVGSQAWIGDRLIDFQDIKRDIDTNQIPGTIFEWYCYNLDNKDYINYRSWCMGLRC